MLGQRNRLVPAAVLLLGLVVTAVVADQSRRGNDVIVAAGGLTTLALALAATVLARSRTRAERRAERLAAELRATNDELRTATRRLSEAAAAGSVGLWERDQSTGATWASDELAGLYGGTTEEWRSLDTVLERMHPDDRADFESSLHDEREPGEVLEQQFRLRHADGSYRWVRSRSRLVVDDDGSHRMVGAHVDMTGDLAREAALAAVNRQLEQANRDLGDFVHILSHDLRSPLRGIQALVGFIEEDAGDAIPAEARAHFAKIVGRVARMQRLLDDLFAYAKAGRANHDLVESDPATIASEVLPLVDGADGFTIDIRSQTGVIPVERTQLTTCLRNLIDNAVKHHRSDGGAISVDFRCQDGDLVVDVTDDGPGIPPEYRDQIFEPFRKLQSGDVVEGSGIGLSIVNRTVDRMGGSVDLVSEPGAGSTFTVRWPLQRTNPADQPREPTDADDDSRQSAHRR